MFPQKAQLKNGSIEVVGSVYFCVKDIECSDKVGVSRCGNNAGVRVTDVAPGTRDTHGPAPAPGLDI